MRRLSWVFLLAACTSTDGSPPDDVDAGSGGCEEDSQCDDGVFCNGEEECVVTTDGVGACVVGDAPCAGECDEDADECLFDCSTNSDMDGDGADAMECGGDDCDDNDAARFPGNTEVCDSAGVDEDCDPSTLGPDEDGDGEVATTCCQLDSGQRRCGSDCDDSLSGVNTGAVETCNGDDDDCDGTVDEGVLMPFYRDVDGDGFGQDGDTQLACSAPTGFAVMGGDCDDALAAINPGAVDGPTVACDDVDNDCDGTVDMGCTCVDGSMRPCGPTDDMGQPLTEGICSQGTQSCNAGQWDTCVNAVFPSTEVCVGGGSVDEDCDGNTDEGLTVSCFPDGDDDGYRTTGSSAQTVCADFERNGDRQQTCPFMFTSRMGGQDCNDTDGAINPGAREVCANGVDDNCSGSAEENCLCGPGCGCPQASLSPRVELRLDIRTMPSVVHAGYRFIWDGTTPMGNGRVDIECAMTNTALANNVEAAGGAPLNVPMTNHEMYLDTVSIGGDGGIISVFIVRQ